MKYSASVVNREIDRQIESELLGGEERLKMCSHLSVKEKQCDQKTIAKCV